MNFVIAEAKEHEIEAIRALLLAEGRPAADLDTSPVEFLVARAGEGPVGVIGLERFAAVGLLRSLAVTPALRGSGLGRRLVDALESRARQSGLHRLALLTETAAPFFSRLAYLPSARDLLPVEMRESAQFRTLCPASAQCMSKSIAP